LFAYLKKPWLGKPARSAGVAHSDSKSGSRNPPQRRHGHRDSSQVNLHLLLAPSCMGLHHLSFKGMPCQAVNMSSENFQLIFRKDFSAMSTSF